jgi:hypothetical protein
MRPELGDDEPLRTDAGHLEALVATSIDWRLVAPDGQSRTCGTATMKPKCHVVGGVRAVLASGFLDIALF